MQKDVRVTKYYIADLEDLRRGPLAKECEQLQETGERKEIESPPEPPEGNADQTHLISAQGHPCQISHPQNCKITNLSYFKSLNLWGLWYGRIRKLMCFSTHSLIRLLDFLLLFDPCGFLYPECLCQPLLFIP